LAGAVGGGQQQQRQQQLFAAGVGLQQASASGAQVQQGGQQQASVARTQGQQAAVGQQNVEGGGAKVQGGAGGAAATNLGIQELLQKGVLEEREMQQDLEKVRGEMGLVLVCTCMSEFLGVDDVRSVYAFVFHAEWMKCGWGGGGGICVKVGADRLIS
jgi:hypothetical protein